MLFRITFILLLFSAQFFSQSKIDSLWNVHNSTEDQHLKIEIKLELAKHYMMNGQYNSALPLTNSLLEYATIENDDSIKAMVYLYLNLIYTEKDQLDLALEYSNKALDYATKINDKRLQSDILENTAILFGKEGDFEREVEYIQRSLKISKEMGHKLNIAISYGNLAIAYHNQGYYETAIDYTLKSMTISQEIEDSVGIAFMNLQLGDTYAATNRSDEAISYYDNAVKLFSKVGSLLHKANSLVSYGEVLTEINDLEKALKTFDKAIDIYKELKLNSGLTTAYRTIAELYIKQKNYILAEKYLKNSLKYFEMKGIKPEIAHTYLLLAEVKLQQYELKAAKDAIDNVEKLLNDKTTLKLYEDLYKVKSTYYEVIRNHKLAYDNQLLLMKIKDSIQTVNNIKQVHDLQIKYDVETKQKENDLLIAQNKVQQLKAEESETIRNFSIVIILILIIVGLILYNRYRAKILLNNKLREANATKDKFFSIISHDLKNPFSTLLGYTDMLILEYKNFSEEEKQNYISSIQKSVKHTYNLLENLLDWSKTQRGEIKVNKKELDLNTLIEKTIKILSPTAKNKNISLIQNIPDNLKMYADEETISTVIRNITTNAIKFTHESGAVVISAFETVEYVKVTIEDNGIGIEKSNLDNIFRIDSHHTTEGTAKEKGTGLGLILCKEFIKQNNGKISVESKVGEGSKFTISLPK